MISNMFKLVFVIGVLFSTTNQVLSNKIKSPAKILSYEVNMIDEKENYCELISTLKLNVQGDVKITLNFPMEISELKRNSKLNDYLIEKYVTKSEILEIKQRFFIPNNISNFRVDIKIDNFSDDHITGRKQFAKFVSIPVFFSSENGKITHSSIQAPESKYTNQPVLVDKTENEKKLRAEYITPHGILPKSSYSITGNYDITIYIAGRISYSHTTSKGIPDVTVWLDWDYDNDPSTGYTPYDGNNQIHVEYDKTDMNGNYYFSFTFVNSPHPANYYSDQIRVYATNSNSACFDHNLGNGAQISEYYYLDILSSTTYISSSSAHISDVEVNQGSALRYLYRARLFSINQLNYTPPKIRYIIDLNGENSVFCDPDNAFLGFYYTSCQNTTMSVPRIIFNHVPEDNATAYHEYGHFVEWSKVGKLVYDDLGGEGHWFEKVTTHNIAWTEGWAEFYAAGCLMHWYSIELPASPEYIIPTKYQWMDYSTSILSSSNDNRKVEGAVACFLYSLWDNVNRRAPNYTGDNDDLGISGSTLLNRIQYRWNIFGQLLASTNVEAYKISLLNGLNSKYHNSINSLYNSIIGQSGNPRSSTATSLNVSGDYNSRTLNWNDNTSPSYFSWGAHNVNIIENNEQGFKIYRKATSSSWDGTLNGYTLVGTVGQNVTSWIDNTDLIGHHSYVVVAYNSSGNSLPQAERNVYYTVTPPIISSLTQNPSPVCEGSYTYVYCNLSQGNGNLSYSWSATNLPAGMSITPMGNKCKVTYSSSASKSGSGIHEIMAPVNQLTCTVSNSAGSDTDSRTIYHSSNCGGCPTLAFEENGFIDNENPILTRSVISEGDVTDCYLIQRDIKLADKKVKFIIHEPEDEHTYLDQVELLEVKVNPNEMVAVSDEGEIVSYKLSQKALSYSSRDKRDIKNSLSSRDNKNIKFNKGESLLLNSDEVKSQQTNEDLFLVMAAQEPPIKEQSVATLTMTGLEESLEPIESKQIFLRPNQSVVAFKLGKNINEKLFIDFMQDVEIDFITIVKNEKKAKVDKLDLLISSHNKSGDVREFVANIDKDYTEIYPGERIDFTFESKNNSKKKIAYVLKTVGRYEENCKCESKPKNSNENDRTIVSDTKLLANHPNPFNPTTQINYQLKESGHVSIIVYDILGKEIATLVNGHKDIGLHQATFNAENLASGIYFYMMRTNSHSEIRKMLLVR